jgi:nucleoside-diphosphate-sugar epimerase
MAGVHVVVGSGVVGNSVVRALAGRGAEVVVVTRSGSGPQGAGIRRVAANAASVEALRAVVPRAVAVYNCANPRYHEWARDWPPMAAALLDYAEQSSAVLATCSNLYGYGPVGVPMVETLPLAAPETKGRIRAQMWLDAKARHDAGRVRVTEVRGSDYIVAGEQSRVGSGRVMDPLLAGKSVSLIGHLDQPHAWTSPTDVGRLLVQVATDKRGWGRAWHVPSNPPRTQRQVIDDLTDTAGVARVKVSQVPDLILRALGLFNPVMREFGEVAYQFERPYLLDDRAAREAFGLEPTPWAEILGEVVAHYRRAALRVA